MSADQGIELARQAIMLLVLLSLPVLVTGLLVALVVSVLQAVTQVQDQTIGLVPRILAMLLAFAITAPWMLSKLIEFGREMFTCSLP
ncbi:MAG: flagellar biosynthetic protein FliQ [Phycisphaerae bacterium]|jgi:flagellar biosynthetic protein FliQ|nr:flagellar biosynthetic protein FliQ [Phycisphaerae bacterium]MDP7287269.1 flagellar biosynthetic protein FliQ [Phycisphaerae bacterium]